MLYNNKTAENNFSYHKPGPDDEPKYHALRARAKNLAKQIIKLCPESREKSLALTNLEQAIFWANASIARNTKEEK